MKKLLILCGILAITSAAFANNASVNADNTGRNVRDQSGNTKTPLDQSESPKDIKLTAAIRHTIVFNGELSALAKNIKIITASGVVTLRGPVKSRKEISIIMSAAKDAGAHKIINKLEIKRR
ncbi:MAG: BON domain-containing protein [Chthoniobacterales bacterium]